jgi:hypothetical protein
VKAIERTPLLTVIRPNVIRTRDGQLAAAEPLWEAAPVAPLATAVGVAVVVALACAPEPEADAAATACCEPAATSKPAASRAAGRRSARHPDAGLAVVI